MRFYIVIPAHNEEDFLGKTLESLKQQSLQAARIVVVNDNSDDSTAEIIDQYKNKIPYLTSIHLESSTDHKPGSKVVKAFNAGLNSLDSNYDVICKFDADLIFPRDYLKTLSETFKSNEKIGMVGGFCYISKDGTLKLEGITSKDHIRGALKAYRKECFEDIGGLRTSMGWDTVDELLARFHNWAVVLHPKLKVEHLKPTAHRYKKDLGIRQGKAFRKLRYGFLLTFIAGLKIARSKSSLAFFFDCMRGYFSKIDAYLVNPEEGKFIRKYRWRGIRSKLLGN